MKRVLFLGWQAPKTRQWYTVGRMEQDGETYTFGYTHGATEAAKAGFRPLSAFPVPEHRYTSDRVFPLFENRVMSEKRPEFDEYVEWLSIPKSEADPVAILSRNGGRRTTDALEVYPAPEVNAEGRVTLHFFLHGVRHQSKSSQERVLRLQPGAPLLSMLDVQNPRDEHAMVLRTAEETKGDMFMLGYLPRYLAGELKDLSMAEQRKAEFSVVRVNAPPAPIHFRLLCRLDVSQVDKREWFTEEPYQWL